MCDSLVVNQTTSNREQCMTAHQVGNVRKFDLMYAWRLHHIYTINQIISTNYFSYNR